MPQDKKSVRMISDMIDIVDLINELIDYEFLVDDSIFEFDKGNEMNMNKVPIMLTLYRSKLSETLPKVKQIIEPYLDD